MPYTWHNLHVNVVTQTSGKYKHKILSSVPLSFPHNVMICKRYSERLYMLIPIWNTGSLQLIVYLQAHSIHHNIQYNFQYTYGPYHTSCLKEQIVINETNYHMFALHTFFKHNIFIIAHSSSEYPDFSQDVINFVNCFILYTNRSYIKAINLNNALTTTDKCFVLNR